MGNSFVFPAEDIEYLDSHYLGQWYKLSEENEKYALLITEFQIPEGYEQKIADLMILMPAGYPGVGLDMFYFDPSLHKLNNKDPGSLSIEEHFGRSWQRWSRHYEWIPGEHGLCQHIEYVRNELEIAGLL